MNSSATISSEIEAKETKLEEILQSHGDVLIAYSGGVDSTYLMAIAHEALGNKALAVIADSPSLPRSELQEALDIAADKGWRVEVIQTAEHLQEEYLQNDPNRCYFCKAELFKIMTKFQLEQINSSATKIAYGAIMDDLGDHRPGAKAAEEFAILAPLQEAELSKEEIRLLSQKRGLSTASKQSFACLASRIPHGQAVSVEKLSQIEMAEEILKQAGFQQYRARHHESICRIETSPEEMQRFFDPSFREKICQDIQKLGYRYVTLDLLPYRTGSTAN